MRRTAVGIDLGTIDVFAANVGRKGVDIVQNGVSERRMPALVSFTERRRLLGSDALAQIKSNCRNSCRDLKHLLGVEPDATEVDTERFWSLCPLTAASDGDVGYEVNYCGEKQCFSAKACLAMLLTSVVATCKAWTQLDVRDVVLAIPLYFPEKARQACLDALHIAGINCLRLLHDTTALALAWRFDRLNYEGGDSKPIVVAFCSAGQSALCVAIARFHQGSVTMLGEAYDRVVSGREMDRMIIDMFAESLKKQGAMDPLSSPKAMLKLEEAATKVKKTISVVDEARGTAECVVEDFDLNCDVKRDAFEAQLAPWADKVNEVVARALSAAELSLADVEYVEIVGGVSRVPWLQRALREAFGGKELSTTLNADEAVARGCAWQAAMLSPLIRLNPIPIQECGHLGLALEWEDSPMIEAAGAELVAGRRRFVVFEQAGPGAEAEVALRCQGAVAVSAVYVRKNDVTVSLGESLGSWNLKFPSKQMEDVEIHCSLDTNGVFAINKAVLCIGKQAEEEAKAKAAEEEAAALAAAEEAKAKAAEEAAKIIEEQIQAQAAEEKAAAGAAEDADAVEAAADAGTDGASQPQGDPEQDHTAAGSGSSEAQASALEAGDAAPAEGTPPTQEAAVADGEAAQEPEDVPLGAFGAEPPKSRRWYLNWRFWQWGRGAQPCSDDAPATSTGPQKKKVGATIAVCKRKEINFTMARTGSLSDTEMKRAVDAELSFRARDESVVHAENARNDYETCIFALRAKLKSGDPIMEFASSDEQSALGEEVDAAETWTYDHMEEEASVYVERLSALKQKDDLFLQRKATLEAIPEKIRLLKASIKKFKASAISPACDHIAKEKLDGVVAECDASTEWLSEVEPKFAARNKWEDPVISAAELTVRTTTLMNNCSKVLSEPRPKPPEPEKKSKKEDKQEKKSKKDKRSNGGDEAEGEEDDASEKGEEDSQPQRRSMLKRMLPFTAVVPVVAALLMASGYGESLGVRLGLSSAGEEAEPVDDQEPVSLE